MGWILAAAVEEVEPGKPKIVPLNGKSVGVFLERGRYFAVLNHCPHFGAPICQGKVFGAVGGDMPEQKTYDAERPVLRCPWHRWEFDMDTGAALAPIKQRIKTYPVKVEDGQIFVEI